MAYGYEEGQAAMGGPAPTAPAQYGYSAGQPFGDPNKFTRSTGEDEINRFNEWMRSQPWWQAVRGSGTGDFSDQQQQAIVSAAKAQGITVPDAFHIDEGGNFNQKSRTKRNLIIAGAIAGGVLTAGAASGLIGGAAGAGSAAGAGAGAAGATGAAAGTGEALASTAIGSGFIPAVGGSGLAALGGGAAAAGGGVGLGTAASAVGTGSKLRGLLTPDNLSAGSRLLGAQTASDANNRGQALSAGLAGDQVALAGRADQRTGETDALRKLAQTNYIQNWQAPTRPAGLPTFGLAPTAPSAAQKQGASDLEKELLKRLAPGGSFQPTDISQYTSPGTSEKLKGLASTGLGILSLLRR